MIRTALLVAAALVAAPAAAQVIEISEPIIRSQGWSTMAGQTVGESRTVLTGQAAFPGITAGLLRGVHSRVDVGARVSFNYGVEGSIRTIAPELKLQAVGRALLYGSPRVNLGVEFAPGVLTVVQDPQVWALSLPVALTVGIPVGSALQLHAALECPLWFDFEKLHLRVPVLAGGGAEYFLDRNLALTLNLRMGPTLQTWEGTGAFTLQTLLGVAWRL